MSTRRRVASAESLDSLLDTLANVVGILIVVMAVTQIHVGDAMERIQRLARDDAASLRTAQAALATRWLSLAPEEDGIARDLTRLRTHRDALAPTFSESDARRARATEETLRAARARLASLRIELASEDARATSRQVRLPDPRPAPPRAEPLTFLVRHGRVLAADLRALESRAVRSVHRFASAGAADDAIPGIFEREDIGDEALRWRVYTAGPRALMAQLRWRDEQRGERPDAFDDSASPLRQALDATSPRRNYVVFHVWSDSFATYLDARRRIEERGFAVGWVPYDRAEEYEGKIPGPGERKVDDPVPID